MLLKAPLHVLLTATIPMVDKELENDGWKRYLCVLQCLAAPVVIIFITGCVSDPWHRTCPHVAPDARVLIGGTYPLWLLFLVIGAVLALGVWTLTSSAKPPRFHTVRC